jgi:ribose 5-phosphate isomerase B
MMLIIGADHLGFKLKESIKTILNENTVQYFDAGVYTEEPADYPGIAEKVANMIIAGQYDRGILICGTGIGMAIAANKVKGIRAAVCHDVYSTERSIKSNNVQIMTLGSQVIGESLAKNVVELWLKTVFTGGPSERKINEITQIENRHENK